ncbi:MAG: SpoIIE family protein phosphatase [Candidatus Omnitrophota bacterium]
MNKAFQFKQECIELYSELHLNALLEKIASKICHFLECDESAMFLYDSTKETLSFETATGEKQDELKKITIKKGEGIVGWVAENKKSIIVNDCAKDPRFTAVTDKKTKFVTSSLVAVPVNDGRKFLGVLEAVNKKAGNFKDEDRELLENIAGFIAIPLLNAMLYKKLKEEASEKGRLLELGKIVSQSFDPRDVFKTLADIIKDLIDPLEINVMINSTKETFRLLSNEKTSHDKEDINETVIIGNVGIFPLRVKDNTVGLMEIRCKKKLTEEAEALIRGVVTYAAISIEKYDMHDQIVEKKKIEKELQIAQQIQQKFLPGQNIELHGLDVACVNIPSSAVGGDYYDVIRLEEHETIFTINDISGHGIPASLLMAISSANFKYRIKKDKDILVTVNYLNDLIAETTEPNQYVTSFTCSVDVKNMRIRYINAGHPAPLLFRAGSIGSLYESDMVLGMFPDIPRSTYEKELKRDDILLLYTDGIAEAENYLGQQFGELLDEFIRRSHHLSARNMKENLIQHLKAFTNKENFVDDVTFIIIKVL